MIDFTGIPSPCCPNCESPRFSTWIIIDPDDYEIGMYGTDGHCAECGTQYSIATPPEHPDIIEQELEMERFKERFEDDED